jgi:hypothetical protein
VGRRPPSVNEGDVTSVHLQSSAAAARLSALDHKLLELVCRLRVVTQTQLERLHPSVAGRTMRYRVLRLQRLGFLGRSRPYRDRGSAPHHLWPTSRADALVRGQPPPRRGERRAPNPLFLAHAAAVSELFVVLSARTAAMPLSLAEFAREGAARQAFRDAGGRQRAIAPDVRIGLRDDCGEVAVVNVELDLGTMSRARLRRKLDGYVAHREWLRRSGVADSSPPLLFVTTSAARADAFLGLAERCDTAMVVAACAGALSLRDSVTVACWRVARREGDMTLGEVIGYSS